MRKISFWAKLNPWKARILITVAQFSIFFLAFLLSRLLKEKGYFFPYQVLPAGILLYVMIVIIYPEKGRYYFRKACDFLLFLTGFVLFSFLFNKADHPTSVYDTLFASTIVYDSTMFKFPESEKIISSFRTDHHKISKKESRVLIKELKYQSHQLTKKEHSDKDNFTIQIIAVILLALLISLGAAYLACAIGCGGADILAAIVLVAGIAAAVLVAVLFINRINRKKREKEKANSINKP